MAFHVERTVGWNAGGSTPEKYRFYLSADVDITSVSGNTATIRVWGSMGVQNNPGNSKNSFKASDFATLGMGEMNLATENQFVIGTEYYQAGLPCIPSGDQSKANRVLAQFRGDTWRNDPINNNNKSSLYIKNSGVVLNTYDGSAYQNYNFDISFDLYVPGTGNTKVLTWTTSGASSATITEWLVEETWVSWFDLDYRPGKVLHSGVWKSTNRGNGGICNLRSGGNWGTMRTVNGGAGTGNPPSMRTNGVWYNQRRIGDES